MPFDSFSRATLDLVEGGVPRGKFEARVTEGRFQHQRVDSSSSACSEVSPLSSERSPV